MALIEKNIKIDGLNISYVEYNSNKEYSSIIVLFLHGWGANKELFIPIMDRISTNPSLNVIALDFPGFGKSDVPNKVIGTIEYTELIAKFIKKLNINRNLILIGHSFGGRICIRLASNNSIDIDIKKIILVDSAGIKPKRKLNYYIKVYSFKLSKKLLKIFFNKEKYDKAIKKLYKQYGSDDYKNANEIMRKILVKVVNEDLTPLLPSVKVPTLLIWGDNDKDTPIYMGKKMEKSISDAGLVILKDAGHYSFLDKLQDFTIIIEKFITMG